MNVYLNFTQALAHLATMAWSPFKKHKIQRLHNIWSQTRQAFKSLLYHISYNDAWVDAKSTPSYSPFQNTSDRGALICSKMCSKKFQNRKKGQKWYIPDKKGRQWCNFSYFWTHLVWVIFLTNLGSIPVKLIFRTYGTPPIFQTSDFFNSSPTLSV